MGLLPSPGECGFTLSDKIFGGTRTRIDEHPWMVLLQYLVGELSVSPFNNEPMIMNSEFYADKFFRFQTVLI